MTARIKFRNKDVLFQSLKKTVPAVDRALRDVLAESGDEMVEKAQQLVPFLDGVLHRSIRWLWTRNTLASAARSPAIVVQAGADSPGDEAFYVRFVEFGAAHMDKQPFFFPAYRLLRRKIKARLSRAMTRVIRKAGF